MKVFISYARNDSRLALAVTEKLRELGHIIFSAFTITAENSLDHTIKSALKECESMIVILNPHSFQSSWVKFEVGHALSDENYKGRLLPVLVGEGFDSASTKVPWILTSLNFLALPSEDEVESNANKIVKEFQKIASRWES